MTHILAVLFSLAGLGALALSMKRHQRDIIGRRLSERDQSLTRAAGWFSIAASLALDMVGFGPAYGTVAWFGHMSIAAWIVVAMLCWRARLN